MTPLVALIQYAALVLPWLNPFAPSPTPAVGPWLFCAACATLIWLLRHRLSVQTVANAWLLAALASAVLGMLQYFGQTHAFGSWVNSSAIGEAYGNLRQRNQFATLTSIGLLSLLWRVSQSNAGATSAYGVRWWLCCAGALLLAAANAGSGSRTGLMQWWLVAVLGVAWWRVARALQPGARAHSRAAMLGVVALALYLIAVPFLPWLLEATTGFHSNGLLGRFKEETGCSSRRLLWSNVLYLIAQKPWLGWGWGELDYAHFITLYPGERFCDILDNAHNLPLHLAVELGVPFALVACTLGTWLVARARPWREADATRQLAWGVLAVIALHSMVEYPLWYGPFQMAAGLCVWLLWRPTAAFAKYGVSFGPLALVGNGFTAIILIASINFAAWDYWRVSQLYIDQSARAPAYRVNTLEKVRDSWLFQSQVQFAEITTTSITPENAAQVNRMAHKLLHFSPEPRVAEKLVESAVMLGRDEEAVFYVLRYTAAFPTAQASWMTRSTRP